MAVDVEGHVNVRRALALVALVAVFGLPAVSANAANAGWVGTFDGFPGAGWAAAWGQSPQNAWGLGDTLVTVSDPTSPGRAVLDARYGAHSSAHSCTNCPTTGAGQFYSEFTGSADAQV